MGDIRTKQESREAIGRAVAYPTEVNGAIDLGPQISLCEIGMGEG